MIKPIPFVTRRPLETKKGTKEQKHHICVLRAHELDDAAKYKACEDIKGNRCHLSITKGRLAIFLADTLRILNVHLHCGIVITDADVLPHHGHQRCESKPPDECKHKAQCSGPECSHVRICLLAFATVRKKKWSMEFEGLELQASILGIHRHFEVRLDRFRHLCNFRPSLESVGHNC